MATCKDCIHFDVCVVVSHNGDDRNLKNSPCKHFKRTADVVMANEKRLIDATPMMNFIHTPYGYCYYHLDKPVSSGGTYLIYGLYVYAEYRRKGHSKRMLRFLIDEIRQAGYDGEIYIKAEPEENSIGVDDLVKYYQEMGLTVCNAEDAPTADVVEVKHGE